MCRVGARTGWTSVVAGRNNSRVVVGDVITHILPICEPKHGYRNPRGCLGERVGQSDQYRDREQRRNGATRREGNGVSPVLLTIDAAPSLLAFMVHHIR
jgi:hypothetical protein